METPSDRVLSSWRQHAREGWEVEKCRHYRPRIILNVPYTDAELKVAGWVSKEDLRGLYAR